MSSRLFTIDCRELSASSSARLRDGLVTSKRCACVQGQREDGEEEVVGGEGLAICSGERTDLHAIFSLRRLVSSLTLNSIDDREFRMLRERLLDQIENTKYIHKGCEPG